MITASRSPRVDISRVASIDVARGIIMVLMAIDHVRVYSGLPAGGPTAGIFFTRWVTHFCAPGFAFLAGTSAFFHGQKIGTAALARYLVVRGALLVALEFTLIHLAWTFAFDFSQQLAGVIWMLGWCMILLAALVPLSPAQVGTIGVIVMGAQQLFRLIPSLLPLTWREATAWFWQLLYVGGNITIGENRFSVSVLYSIVPWIGVMAAGYGFGTIMRRDRADRRRLCLRIGLTATLLFLAIGGLQVVLASPGDDDVPWLFRLLNQNKYRESQLFLLMTLGPMIAVLPFLERAPGWFSTFFSTFGGVPLFYYLLHIPLIHAASLLIWRLRDGHVDAFRFSSAPYVSIPPEEWWSLPLLYLVFAVVVALLYIACHWYAGVKARQPRSWLRYV